MAKRQMPMFVLVMALAALSPAVVCAQGTLFVEGGNVGVGIETPDVPFHVFSSNGTAQFKVEETSSTASSRTLMQLTNNGGIRFNMQTGPGPVTWQFGALAHFIINYSDHPGNEMRLLQNGDLEIGGTLSEGSSREIKEAFEPIDGRQVLDRLAGMPLSKWQYKTDDRQARHLGPMAEDFHAAFGLGADERHVSPRDIAGVALAAIQGLKTVVEEKDQEIQDLSQKIARIEARLDTRADEN